MVWEYKYNFYHEIVEGHSKVILKLFLDAIYNSLRLGLSKLHRKEDMLANCTCLNNIQYPKAVCQLF